MEPVGCFALIAQVDQVQQHYVHIVLNINLQFLHIVNKSRQYLNDPEVLESL